jgi:hypothetical protein
LARGFESKQIEFQQEESQRKRTLNPPLTPEARAARERREALGLARARALADLQRACNPAHRAMLEQALAALDEQLSRLDSTGHLDR